MSLHCRWHWYWALLWSALRWNERAASHIDAWLQASEDPLVTHVLDPNGDRPLPRVCSGR